MFVTTINDERKPYQQNIQQPSQTTTQCMCQGCTPIISPQPTTIIILLPPTKHALREPHIHENPISIRNSSTFVHRICLIRFKFETSTISLKPPPSLWNLLHLFDDKGIFARTCNMAWTMWTRDFKKFGERVFWVFIFQTRGRIFLKLRMGAWTFFQQKIVGGNVLFYLCQGFVPVNFAKEVSLWRYVYRSLFSYLVALSGSINKK